MAIEDLTTLQPPFATKEIVLPVALTRQVSLPKWARRISLRFVGGDGQYADLGSDNGPMVADHQTVAAGLLHSLSTDHGGKAGLDTDEVQIYVAHTTGGILRITLEMGV